VTIVPFKSKSSMSLGTAGISLDLFRARAPARYRYFSLGI